MELIEFTESDTPAKLEDGIIRDVLVHGSVSRNRRHYDAKAMADVARLAEGVAVYCDHPSSIDRDRKGRAAEDRFGILRNVRLVESADKRQVRGDLHHLQSHPLSERVEEDLRRGLNLFGLSLLADGSGRQEKGATIVESVESLKEVDLVTNPATAVSLREQAETATAESPAAEPPAEEKKEEAAEKNADAELVASIEAVLKEAAVVVSDPASSLGDKKAALESAEGKIKELFAAHLGSTTEEPPAEEVPGSEPVMEQTATLAASIKSLTEQVTTLAKDVTALKAKPKKYLGNAPPSNPVALAEQTRNPGGIPTEPNELARWLKSRP